MWRLESLVAHKPQWKMDWKESVFSGEEVGNFDSSSALIRADLKESTVGHTKLLHVLLTSADTPQRAKKTQPVPAGRKEPAEPRHSELIFSRVRQKKTLNQLWVLCEKGRNCSSKEQREKREGREWLAVPAGGRELPLFKLPDNLATSLVLGVWDGTPPLDADPSSPLPLHLLPAPLLPHPAYTEPRTLHTEPSPNAGKPPWKCVPNLGGCGPRRHLNCRLAVEGAQSREWR